MPPLLSLPLERHSGREAVSPAVASALLVQLVDDALFSTYSSHLEDFYQCIEPLRGINRHSPYWYIFPEYLKSSLAEYLVNAMVFIISSKDDPDDTDEWVEKQQDYVLRIANSIILWKYSQYRYEHTDDMIELLNRYKHKPCTKLSTNVDIYNVAKELYGEDLHDLIANPQTPHQPNHPNETLYDNIWSIACDFLLDGVRIELYNKRNNKENINSNGLSTRVGWTRRKISQDTKMIGKQLTEHDVYYNEYDRNTDEYDGQEDEEEEHEDEEELGHPMDYLLDDDKEDMTVEEISKRALVEQSMI